MKPTVISLICALLMALVSCGAAPLANPTDESQQGTQDVQFREDPSISALPLYDCILLDTEETILILDVADGQALISVHVPYSALIIDTQTQEWIREQGVVDVTSRLLLVDLDSMEIEYEYRPETSQFCNDGLILADKIVYTAVDIGASAESRYTLNEIDGSSAGYGAPQTISQGTCLVYDGSMPEIQRLSQDAYVFYHADFDTKTFGIDIVSWAQIQPQHVFQVKDTTYPLRNGLKSAHGTYTLYIAMEGRGTLLWGKLSGETGAIVLKEENRMYDHVLVADGVLLSLEKGLRLVDLAGNTIMEQDGAAPKLRMVSDGLGTVMHIDGTYHAYIMTVSADGVQSKALSSLPADPVLFYTTGAGSFLAHYYYEGQGEGASERCLMQIGEDKE